MLSCVQPCVPCLFGCFVGCHSRVVWRVPQLDRDSRRTCVLTIDDFPSSHTTPRTLLKLLQLLDEYDAFATFFVIRDNMKVNRDSEKLLSMLVDSGHEVGIHWKGRWGCCKPLGEYLDEAAELKGIERRHGTHIQFCRPPGGFSTATTVEALMTRLGLTTVIGTAYSGDADVCRDRTPRWQGEAAAAMASDGGCIAILHDDAYIHDKVHAFLEHAALDGLAPPRSLCVAITGLPPGVGGSLQPIPAMVVL